VKAKYLSSKALKLSPVNARLQPLLAMVEIMADNPLKVKYLLKDISDSGYKVFEAILSKYFEAESAKPLKQYF